MTTRREKPDVIGTSSLSERGHHDGWLAHRHRPLAARAYLAPVAVSGAAVRGSVRSSSCSGRCRQAGAVLRTQSPSAGRCPWALRASPFPNPCGTTAIAEIHPAPVLAHKWRTLRTVTIPPRDAGPRLKIVVSRVGIRISPGLVTPLPPVGDRLRPRRRDACKGRASAVSVLRPSSGRRSLCQGER